MCNWVHKLTTVRVKQTTRRYLVPSPDLIQRVPDPGTKTRRYPATVQVRYLVSFPDLIRRVPGPGTKTRRYPATVQVRYLISFPDLIRCVPDPGTKTRRYPATVQVTTPSHLRKVASVLEKVASSRL